VQIGYPYTPSLFCANLTKKLKKKKKKRPWGCNPYKVFLGETFEKKIPKKQGF
jgi:hypothetical protein